MKKRRLLSVLFCAMMLFNAVSANYDAKSEAIIGDQYAIQPVNGNVMIAEQEKGNEPVVVAGGEQVNPFEADISVPQDELPTAPPSEEPVAQPSEEPTTQPSEEPTAPPSEEPTTQPSEEPTTQPSEEPTTQPSEEPTAQPSEEPTAQPSEEPTAQPSEEPAALPSEEPAALPSEEPAAPLVESTIQPEKDEDPESGELTELVREASKKLPDSLPAAKSSASLRSLSSFEMWVDVNTDYINLNDSPGASITWTIETYGGSGYFLYAFDVYKDGKLYSYMPAYGYDNYYSFSPTEPGRYSVRGFAYDWDTWREMIEWSWYDTGVSTLSIDSILSSTDIARAGDELVWTVQTSGETGKLSYFFNVYYSENGSDFFYLDGSKSYVESNVYNYTVSLAGQYYVFVYVWEEDITGRDLYVQSEYTSVEIGEPTLEVYGIGPDTYYPWISVPITWSVYASNPVGLIQCEFHLYANGVRIESTDWLDQTEYTFTPQRSGNYWVEAFVRDSAYPDILYRTKSNWLGVSDLHFISINVDKTSAYLGDTVTWSVDMGGGSGSVYYVYTLYLNGNLYYEEGYWSENDSFSYVVSEPGEYWLTVDVYDEYCNLTEDSSITTVNVRPIAPSITTIEPSSATSLTVSWGSVAGVSGYEVWRSTSSTGTYTKVKTVTLTSYNDTGRTSGTAYYYKVRAYKTVGTTKHYSSYSSVKAGVALANPAISKATAASGSSITVTWNNIAGESGYELWRSTSSNGSYTKVYTGTSTSYTNTGRTAGTAYYYKVRAYKTIGTTKYYSLYSSAKIGVALAKPATPTAKVSSKTSVTVSWAAVTGATGYELVRSTSATGTYSSVYSGTDRSYINSSLTTGKTYYYKVRAYKLVGTTKYYGPYSSYKAVTPK